MKSILFGCVVGLLALIVRADVAWSQAADVPEFDTNGNFRSARVQGNRGFYPHEQWLIVDRDPEGLNCRDGSGAVALTLYYGAVVASNFEHQGDDPIDIVNGQAWLRVEANIVDVQRRITAERAASYICYVRANARYIAPINPSSLSDRI